VRGNGEAGPVLHDPVSVKPEDPESKSELKSGGRLVGVILIEGDLEAVTLMEADLEGDLERLLHSPSPVLPAPALLWIIQEVILTISLGLTLVAVRMDSFQQRISLAQLSIPQFLEIFI